MECDTATTQLNVLNDCDPITQIKGTASTAGTVSGSNWLPSNKITIMTTATTPSYSDMSSPSATCSPGDGVTNSASCYVAATVSSNTALFAATDLRIDN